MKGLMNFSSYKRTSYQPQLGASNQAGYNSNLFNTKRIETPTQIVQGAQPSMNILGQGTANTGSNYGRSKQPPSATQPASNQSNYGSQMMGQDIVSDPTKSKQQRIAKANTTTAGGGLRGNAFKSHEDQRRQTSTAGQGYMMFDYNGSRVAPSTSVPPNNAAEPVTSQKAGPQVLPVQQIPQRTQQNPTLMNAQKSEENKQASAAHAATDEDIVIHVFDENRKISKDFKCNKTLLLSQMKYFEQYLVDVNSLDDIDISVHCDIKIFDWLMRYLKNDSDPKLDTKNVISILISSDFLGMARLVDQSVQYVRANINEVVRLPIDMNCLNQTLIKKIADSVSMDELVNMNDRKDKLMSKIYMKKLEGLIDNEHTLHRCVYCDGLFTAEQREWLVCPKAKIFIDFHGSVIAEHVPDRYWELNRFIQFLQKDQVPWREIYWKIWSRFQTFQCSSCGERFVSGDLYCCSYHPNPPKFQYGSNTGQFPCCGIQALRFDTSIKKHGCKSQMHQINTEILKAEDKKVYDLLIQHSKYACDAYIISDDSTSSEDQQKKVPSLNSLLQKFFSANKNIAQQRKLFEFEEDEVEEDMFEEMYDFNGSNQTQASEIGKRKSVTNGMNNPQAQRKTRVMARDQMRTDDWSSMKDLMGKMRKHRVEDKQQFRSSSIPAGANPSNNERQGVSASKTEKSAKDSSPQKALRPLSEPNSVKKKSMNYRIKNQVIRK